MFRRANLLTACLLLAAGLYSAAAHAAMPKWSGAAPRPEAKKRSPFAQEQETGFLNRRIDFHGVTYKFQVYLPEEFHRDDKKPWPIALFLHGRGERGSEGMWQTQIGLPQALRDHPERWPFIVVMPQCTFPSFWTDPEMLAMAMAALDQEQAEFRTDPARTYLTGLSMGGYGAWELAKMYPKRWAAVAIASGGIFWSYAPERWQDSAALPGDYARAIGKTPIWLFHGSEDTTVPEKESELMYAAFKANAGNIKLWVYQGYHHDSWTRAFNEPELPHWLLTHRATQPETQPFAERLVLSAHPAAIKLSIAALDVLTGDYHDASGKLVATLYRQGEQLFQRSGHGDISPLEAESPTSFFYPQGGVWTRLIVERDSQGRITGLLYRDDRHEEHWERKRITVAGR